jgi:8-oxo-dGTP pyrophosphatase MutT (NUDIX family)
MLKRQSQSGFWPDAHVFPGGVLEEVDYLRADPHRSAAVRETQEECGLVIDVRDLIPISWWMTPVTETRRYDTRFFWTPAPPGQTAQVNLSESSAGEWVRPAVMLEGFERGEIKLAPPTYWVLSRLAQLHRTEDLPRLFDRPHECICPDSIDKQTNLV